MTREGLSSLHSPPEGLSRTPSRDDQIISSSRQAAGLSFLKGFKLKNDGELTNFVLNHCPFFIVFCLQILQ